MIEIASFLSVITVRDDDLLKKAISKLQNILARENLSPFRKTVAYHALRAAARLQGMQALEESRLKEAGLLSKYLRSVCPFSTAVKFYTYAKVLRKNIKYAEAAEYFRLSIMGFEAAVGREGLFSPAAAQQFVSTLLKIEPKNEGEIDEIIEAYRGSIQG